MDFFFLCFIHLQKKRHARRKRKKRKSAKVKRKKKNKYMVFGELSYNKRLYIFLLCCVNILRKRGKDYKLRKLKSFYYVYRHFFPFCSILPFYFTSSSLFKRLQTVKRNRNIAVSVSRLFSFIFSLFRTKH